MNTRADAYVKSKAREVITNLIEQQEIKNMSKQYTPNIKNSNFTVKVVKPNLFYTGIVKPPMGIATLRNLLQEEHQVERFEANEELPKLNREWANLEVKALRLIAEIDKLAKYIDTTTPKIADDLKLAGKVVQATDERELLDKELSKIRRSQSTMKSRMDSLGNIVTDDLVKHSQATLNTIAKIRELIAPFEEEAKRRLAYSEQALKGKFELPVELAEQVKVEPTDKDGATVINRAGVDRGYGSIYGLDDDQLQAIG